MKIVDYNNIEFYIGENAKDNWEIFDALNKENNNYIWFHLNSFSSPYVIMKQELTDIPKEEQEHYLNYGAILCKSNTKYRYIKNIKVCYTTLKKLKKSNIIGELLIQGKVNIIKP